MINESNAMGPPGGLWEQHHRDSMELRYLYQARDDARRERDKLKALNAELLEALEGLLRVADCATNEFDAGREAIAKATGVQP